MVLLFHTFVWGLHLSKWYWALVAARPLFAMDWPLWLPVHAHHISTPYLQWIGPCGHPSMPILFICNGLALVAARPRLLLYNGIIWSFSTQELASLFCRLAA